jgi:hypothetical protein
MSLSYKVENAERIVQEMDGDEWSAMKEICTDIRDAQSLLLQQGRELMRHCVERCEGLCCRNIHPDDIINQADLVFVCTLERSMARTLAPLVKSESLFSGPCPFLLDGRGPCVFPSAVRPERCLLTFCGEASSIREEVRTVRRAFSRLHRFLRWRKPRRFVDRVLDLLPS